MRDTSTFKRNFKCFFHSNELMKPIKRIDARKHVAFIAFDRSCFWLKSNQIKCFKWIIVLLTFLVVRIKFSSTKIVHCTDFIADDDNAHVLSIKLLFKLWKSIILSFLPRQIYPISNQFNYNFVCNIWWNHFSTSRHWIHITSQTAIIHSWIIF